MKRIGIFLALIAAISSCNTDQTNQNVTGEVEIFELTWSTENLNKVVLNNGDSLLKCTRANDWVFSQEEGIPAYMYYDFSDSLGAIYGAIYNSHAITDERGLAPMGWHIPSEEEVATLKKLGDNAKFTLRSAGNLQEGNGQWREPINYDHWDHLLDSTGFHAIPSGEAFMHANPDAIRFGSLHSIVTYWTSSPTKNNPETLESWYLMQNNVGFMQINYGTSRTKGSGFYVRCVKDN